MSDRKNPKMVALHNQWKGFTAERGRAKQEMLLKAAEIQQQIEALRAEVIGMSAGFDEEWRQYKTKLQEERDAIVMEELATGRSAQDILRELGSNNTVWIYDLRAKVQAGKGIPSAGNINTSSEVNGGQVNVTMSETGTLDLVEILPGVKWLHHKHVGVHGWLVSADRHYVKKYGVPDTEFEGLWFICDRSHNFIGGSKEFFDATPKGEVTKRSNMLLMLIDGLYTGRVREVENPFTS